MHKSQLNPESLAYRLLCAARVCMLVRAGNALPQSLAQVWEENNSPLPARGAIQDIAYRTMRQLGRVDVLITQLTKNTPEPPLLHALLSSALALLSNPEDAPYGNFTVVDQAVTAASSHPEIARAKGMVNAVLRRFLREQETMLATAMKNPVAEWNYPRWWIDTMRTHYPDSWQAILQAGNAPPPLTLRVNRRKSSIESYLAMLSEHGIHASQIGQDAVRLAKPVPVAQIPGFTDGLVSVQDAAAQLAAPLLDVQDGMRVLDACAAPGGKTGHILEYAKVDLLALDSDPQRLARINQNLQRLDLSATLAVGDASKDDWWDGQPFDRILADVPCTASGIVRRHPDIRWLRRPDDAAKLAALSARILDNLWRMLRPDGKLLFVTCSLWPQESEAQANAFAQRHNARRLEAPGQLLPLAEVQHDHDGLFYALFQKAPI